MPQITVDDLQTRYDFPSCDGRVKDTIEAAMDAGPASFLRFLYRYAEWNGFFGSGVATLAGKVGRSRGLFMDPEETITPLADRGVLVAAYVFNAARDEFDDSGTEALDTHRCLAQAMLKGSVEYLTPGSFVTRAEDGTAVQAPFGWADGELDELLDIPIWLQGLCDQVAVGYGNGSPDDRPSIFRAMGYHMGSEVLAAKEFTQIDMSFRARMMDMVEYLERNEVTFNSQSYQCYYWIRIHSDLGGAVESAHFEDALRAIRYALGFVPEEDRDALRYQALLGFDDFAADHAGFFRMVNTA